MKKTTWIMLAILSIISVVGFWKYFDKVFPIVNLSITMDRNQAHKKALEFATKNNFNVQGYDVAMQFKEDGMLQAFVELEGGGKQVFREMIDKGYHQPYEWAVRFYKPKNIHEIYVYFTPDGKLNKFSEKLPEDEKGASLSKDQAFRVALNKLKELGLDMPKEYYLVEHNKIEQPSGRIDHTFVYQREDMKLNEGLYRIKLKVFGDKLSGFEKIVKIPDDFLRRYQEMFAQNKLIASVAQNIAIFLYIFIIALLLLLFFYHDKKYLLLKKHAYLMFVFFMMMLFAMLNNWNFYWNLYPTNISPFLFAFKQMLSIITITTIFSLFVGFICIITDAADRYIFGRHIQFLKSWSWDVLASYQVLEMTLLGYLGAAMFLGYQVIYAFWTQSMGWWSPLGQLFDPNTVSTYFPFFSPIATAFKAGFWEEFVFRGLPLAGVAFLTRNNKSKKWWFLLMVLVQAIIFGALHANYPQQPAYNRIIEIFLPSIMFAAFYYMYGLLPGIITHFIYDAVLMCIPIWISDLYLDKICAVICILMPLLLVLIRYLLQNKTFKNAPLSAYNDAEKYTTVLDEEDIFQRPVSCTLTPKRVNFVILFTILGLGFSYFSNQWNFFNFKSEITAKQAVTLAEQVAIDYGFDPSTEWTLVTEFISHNSSEENKFIWQSYGGMSYQDLEKDYIPAHAWKVCWKKFVGSVENRAESFEVDVSVSGAVLAISHTVSESQEGADLDEKKAEKLGLKLLLDVYNLDKDQVALISLESLKHQNRRDYTIVYKDLHRFLFKNDEGQARITVKLAGDKLLSIKKAIHVPETFKRSEQNRITQDTMLAMILFASLFIIILCAVYICLKRIKLSTKLVMPVLFFSSIYFIVRILNLLNGWDQILGILNTAEPLLSQVISVVSSYALYFLAVGFLYLFTTVLFIRSGVKSNCNQYSSWALLLVLLGMSFYSFISWFMQFPIQYQALDYEYQFVNFKFPAYGLFVAYFLQNSFVQSLKFMSFSIVADYLKSYKQEFLILCYFMFIGILLQDFASFSNIGLWIVAGITVGLCYYLLNKYIVSQDMESAFLLSFGMSIMKILPSVILQTYVGIVTAFLLSFSVFLILLLYLYKRI